MERVSSVEEWLKLPEVSVPSLDTDREAGLVLKIAKVGFLSVEQSDCKAAGIDAEGPGGKRILPTATVETGTERGLHRLPTELGEWAFNCVALAGARKSLFPCDVEFGRLHGRVYAEFTKIRTSLN
jgi:hypothetical protein